MLDNMKYGTENGQYWEIKEGRAQSQYPNLLTYTYIGPSRRNWIQVVEDGLKTDIRLE